MLTDEVTIRVTAGKGGEGSASFRRERFVPKGGPDGGDGGNGGDIIFQVSSNVNTLTFFNTRKAFRAENGGNGKAAKCKGKDGGDLILNVPRGTIIYELRIKNYELGKKNDYRNSKNQKKLGDFTKIGQEFVVARGGRGGWGNVHFATATHQTPREFNPGTPGEEKIIRLELRLIADVGLIGLPNSGKSTLLSRISKARPKIANYPFTTLEPNLGVVTVDKTFSFIAADIPGLIEGASKGRGLGYKFLRHIQRTKLVVHLIESLSKNPLKDYQIIKNELKVFNPILARKPEIVIISKVDLFPERQQRRLYAQVAKLKPLFVSSVTGRGINDLLYEIKKKLVKNNNQVIIL